MVTVIHKRVILCDLVDGEGWRTALCSADCLMFLILLVEHLYKKVPYPAHMKGIMKKIYYNLQSLIPPILIEQMSCEYRINANGVINNLRGMTANFLVMT